MNEKNTSKFIRPAGAFPNTPEGWKEYEDQWALETEGQDEAGNN